MKLYEVTNGYIGFGVVKVLAIAKDKEAAIKLARRRFKEQAKKCPRLYDEDYYNDLQAKCICDNVNEEWVSEIRDE